MNPEQLLLHPPDEGTFSALYREHALGLYRRRSSLRDPDKALVYARSAVLNRSRSVLRRRRLPLPRTHLPPVWSAETEVLLGEDRRQVLLAPRRLPARQREAVVERLRSLPEVRSVVHESKQEDFPERLRVQAEPGSAPSIRADLSDLPGVDQVVADPSEPPCASAGDPACRD